jgi:hypothetical protein
MVCILVPRSPSDGAVRTGVGDDDGIPEGFAENLTRYFDLFWIEICPTSQPAVAYPLEARNPRKQALRSDSADQPRWREKTAVSKSSHSTMNNHAINIVRAAQSCQNTFQIELTHWSLLRLCPTALSVPHRTASGRTALPSDRSDGRLIHSSTILHVFSGFAAH